METHLLNKTKQFNLVLTLLCLSKGTSGPWDQSIFCAATLQSVIQVTLLSEQLLKMGSVARLFPPSFDCWLHRLPLTDGNKMAMEHGGFGGGDKYFRCGEVCLQDLWSHFPAYLILVCRIGVGTPSRSPPSVRSVNTPGIKAQNFCP